MNYTPYASLTDEELVLLVCNKHDPTDLELELAERLSSRVPDGEARDDGYSEGYAAGYTAGCIKAVA